MDGPLAGFSPPASPSLTRLLGKARESFAATQQLLGISPQRTALHAVLRLTTAPVTMARPAFATRYARHKRGTEELRACLVRSARAAQGAAFQEEDKIKAMRLLQFAKAVYDAWPKIEIPMSILHIIKDVIAGRSASAGFFQGLEVSKSQIENSGHASLADQNRTHQCFIDILKRVRDLLETTARRADGPKSNKGDKHSAGEPPASNLLNIFEHLDLEEPSLAEAASKPLVKGTTKAKPRQRKCELEIQEKDTLLAIWALFENFSDVRASVDSAWADFYNGRGNIMVALETTDAASMILQDMDIAIGKAHLEYINAWRISSASYVTTGTHTPLVRRRHLRQPRLNTRTTLGSSASRL